MDGAEEEEAPPEEFCVMNFEEDYNQALY